MAQNKRKSLLTAAPSKKGKKLRAQSIDEELYHDSTSSDDDDIKHELPENNKEDVTDDNIRCLQTNNHCFSAFESIITELTMLLTYIFVVLCISLILTSTVIGTNHEYFGLSVSGAVLCAILGCFSFYIYKKYDKRIMNNLLADYILYDKTKNLFQIYTSKRTEICGCFGLKNESHLLWECSLSGLQRCEYLETTRIMVIYFYDQENGNDEMKQFQKKYFVDKQWEMDINSKLTQCKFDWNIKTRTS